MSAMDVNAAESDSLLVIAMDGPAARARRSPRPEPMRRLSVAVPSVLADELKQAVSVIPGASLDALVAEALRRVLAEHGAPPPLPLPRRADDEHVFVVVP